MPLKQFVEDYGGSMQMFLLKDVQDRLAASVATATEVAATATRTRNKRAPPLGTQVQAASRGTLIHI